MKNLKSFSHRRVNNMKYWLVVIFLSSNSVLQSVNGDEADAASTTLEPRKSLDIVMLESINSWISIKITRKTQTKQGPDSAPTRG